uniref:Uncharacterized protein n=1 Tax=Acrobeloides nanus TaxID=290746 RepID=A0A914DHY5_9BILA
MQGGMDPVDYINHATFAYDTSITTCPNFCGCNSAGTCYVYMGSPDSFDYAPYCDPNTGTCCINVFINAGDGTTGLMSQDGMVMFTGDGQLGNGPNGFNTFSCSGTGAYAIVTEIYCNGCPTARASCMGTATATG